MKKLLLLLFVLGFSSCLPLRTGYIDYRQGRMYDWDPIYYVPGYVDPFFYRREPPVIIYRDRVVPRYRTPQRPRTENLRPYTPQPPTNPNRGSAPIRQFPKKDDKKEK
jgi:hypothetical protein